MGPLTGIYKERSFEGTKATKKAFETIKDRLCSAPILALPNFDLLFEVDCGASGVGIGAILTQAKCPISLSSEKLNGSRHNCATYNKEFYTIIRALEHWTHSLKLRVPFKSQGIILIAAMVDTS